MFLFCFVGGRVVLFIVFFVVVLTLWSICNLNSICLSHCQSEDFSNYLNSICLKLVND